MRLQQLHLPTLREPPKDAETVSHQLLVRAGYIRRIAAGIYSFLPLGVRSLEKVKAIIRQEMDRAGAQEVFMPAIIPAELWQQSGRWPVYGPELLRLKDRKQADYCVGPTHEEVVVDLARKDIRSYKQLPVNLYQIQTKFRDEMRPRAGLMRGREFVMKDAYSFDADVSGAHGSYQAMYDAYCRIFSRMGLEFRPVEADTGNIGGSMSHEFQVLAESGEDAIVACDACTFAANVEKAPLPDQPFAATGDTGPARVVDTPGTKTIETLCALLGCRPDQTIKAVLFTADDAPAVAFVRGDREVNEVKVRQALGCKTLYLADAEWFAKTTGLPPGYLGAVGTGGVRTVLDHEIKAMPIAVCGANAKQQHLVDVVPARDLATATYADLRMAVAGDPCPRCAGRLRGFRGIEVGHVFYLGTKYSKAMQATFLDEAGKETLFEMGCYGIGVTRILAAAIEQNHDERGIRWPVALAPFEVAVLPMAADGPQAELARSLYASLNQVGVQAVIDDRAERPGIKFADADLVGYPVQIIVGKRAGEGVVEIKLRHTGQRAERPAAGLVDRVAGALAAARRGGGLALSDLDA
ncbi:MAG: proline--tRNA ligase [Deltaproteobacteria bacterium]|nr:proline--tRNA ligase [Deltaproteobacteria bacterium]